LETMLLSSQSALTSADHLAAVVEALESKQVSKSVRWALTGCDRDRGTLIPCGHESV
jgi:hypothetical protein